MLPQILQLKRVALDLLFPPYCIGCGREGNYICSRCERELPFISPPVCEVCGRPLTADNECPGCISKEHAIDGIRAPFLFTGLIRRAIHELKYRNLRALAPGMAVFLSDYLDINPVQGYTLVPVPIHPKRIRERGYNQTSLVAHELGRLTGLPVTDDCLVRLTYVAPQVKLATAAERQKNISGAFACKNDKLAGKQVILLDDVSTSGATLNACAAALKAAGAAGVWGLTLALEL